MFDAFPSGKPKKSLFPNGLSYLEFLQTLKVIRMLYGTQAAKKYLTDNIDLYYNVDNA